MSQALHDLRWNGVRRFAWARSNCVRRLFPNRRRKSVSTQYCQDENLAVHQTESEASKCRGSRKFVATPKSSAKPVYLQHRRTRQLAPPNERLMLGRRRLLVTQLRLEARRIICSLRKWERAAK